MNTRLVFNLFKNKIICFFVFARESKYHLLEYTRWKLKNAKLSSRYLLFNHIQFQLLIMVFQILI